MFSTTSTPISVNRFDVLSAALRPAENDLFFRLSGLEGPGPVEGGIDGGSVSVAFDSDGNRADVTVNGQPETFKRTRWLDWFEFHPETAVYGRC